MKSQTTVSKVFLIDKEAGVSSFHALSSLKRDIGSKKVGHAGTLDPFATGALIAMSGKMTKALDILVGSDKEYLSVFRFGEETDTLDTEGRIIHHAALPDINTIEQALNNFKGRISQVPPKFSAVKIDGKRAYWNARKGVEVQIPERQVWIHDITILNWQAPLLSLRIRCSKGTYIRSIARDLGLASGSRAYCFGLRRTAIGPFRVEDEYVQSSTNAVLSLSSVEFCRFMDFPLINVDNSSAAAMRRGRPLNTLTHLKYNRNMKDMLAIDSNGIETALLKQEDGHLRYRIIFD